MNVKVEYPRWKYHAEMGGVIVHDALEESALGMGWADSPADLIASDERSLAEEIEEIVHEKVESAKRSARKGKA